jgi:phosphohistidine phosphatase SixA
MKKHYSRLTSLILICLIIFLHLSCTTTIYLVRHAERLNNSPDSPLNGAGFQRADALRDSLLGKNIDSVFVSTFIRTQQTAQPLCTALHKNFTIYNRDTSVQLASHLKKMRGKDILVVGHTENIPTMVNEIANQTVDIPSDVFNKMFIIKIKRSLSTKISLRETTYGNPSP